MAEPVDANKALTITVDGSKFHPTFTYPIYGEKEVLEGYVNPKIDLEFDSKTMLPLVTFSYDSKEEESSNLEEILNFLPENTLSNRNEWEQAVAEELKTFQVPGTKVSSFDHYSVYKTNLDEFKTYLQRIQIFVLLFIEAGSFIDQEDTRWELYLVFDDKTGAFVGFTSVYPYFYYKDGPTFDAGPGGLNGLVRKRISQFLILKPYQRSGIGRKLYNSLVELFTADENVAEVTVEDPNEAFDDMRDRADVERLEKVPAWQDLDLPLSSEEVFDLTKKYKMVPRQLQRVLEMSLLKKHQNEPKDYRYFVKQRLWTQNYESLRDLDPAAQRDIINETYSSVIELYKRLLHLDVEDEEEDDEEEEQVSKKARLD